MSNIFIKIISTIQTTQKYIIILCLQISFESWLSKIYFLISVCKSNRLTEESQENNNMQLYINLWKYLTIFNLIKGLSLKVYIHYDYSTKWII